MFKSGADKVCLNSQFIKNPKFVKKCIKIFGSSNTVAIVEAVKIKDKYFISHSNGRDLVKINPIKWSKFLEMKELANL